MIGKMLTGARLRCRHCGQKSKPRPGVGRWETLGKAGSFVVMACLDCGHGLEMGAFVERHVDANTIERMKTEKAELLEQIRERLI